jgi:hypothetical protein
VKPFPPALAVPIAAMLLLWGCGRPSTPAPEPVPSLPATLPPVTAVPAAPTATRPATPAPTWADHDAGAFTISLPVAWKAAQPGALEEALPAFEQRNPELARLLGTADARPEAVFTSAGAARAFAENLTIRRMPVGSLAAPDMPGLADVVAAQYRTLGFEVLDTATVEIGGLPAAQLAYTFAAAGDDLEARALGGLQVMVAAPSDLWILTFTASGDRFSALRPDFEESARSFRVRS